MSYYVHTGFYKVSCVDLNFSKHKSDLVVMAKIKSGTFLAFTIINKAINIIVDKY